MRCIAIISCFNDFLHKHTVNYGASCELHLWALSVGQWYSSIWWPRSVECCRSLPLSLFIATRCSCRAAPLSLVFKKCLRPCSDIGLYNFCFCNFSSNFPLSMMKELPLWKVASIENSLSIKCHTTLATLNQLLLFFSSLHICLRKLSDNLSKLHVQDSSV